MPCFQPARKPRQVTTALAASAKPAPNSTAIGIGSRTPSATATRVTPTAASSAGSAAERNGRASCRRQRVSGATPRSSPIAIASGAFTRL